MDHWVRSKKSSVLHEEKYTLNLKLVRLEVSKLPQDKSWTLSIYEVKTDETVVPSMFNDNLVSGQMQVMTKAMELIEADGGVLAATMVALHTKAQAARDKLTGS